MLPTNLINHLKDEDVTATELGVWIILSGYRNDQTGLCCPSQEELADRCQLSRPTIRRILHLGEELGLYQIKESVNSIKRVFHSYEWSPHLCGKTRPTTSDIVEKRDPGTRTGPNGPSLLKKKEEDPKSLSTSGKNRAPNVEKRRFSDLRAVDPPEGDREQRDRDHYGQLQHDRYTRLTEERWAVR